MAQTQHSLDASDLASLATGDGEAFARVYRARFPFTLALARRVTRLDEPTCLDIVQDAWVRFVRSPPSCDSEGHLDAWLRLAVLSAARDHARREKRRRTRELASRNGYTDALGEGSVGEAQERLAWIAKELEQLDKDTRAMLGLRFRAAMTLQQIGAAMGVKHGAADGRMTRALRVIRERAQEVFRD